MTSRAIKNIRKVFESILEAKYDVNDSDLMIY